MNSPPSNFHILIEPIDAGQITASIAELPYCHFTASTREAAIHGIQTLVRDRLANIEVIPFPTDRENPWLEFIGMFENDADFHTIAAELRAERELIDL